MADYVPESYEHLTGPARRARRALFAVTLIQILAAGLVWAQLSVVEYPALWGPAQHWAFLRTADSFLFVVRIPLALGGFVLFLAWFHRAYSNLEPIAGSRRHAQFWAVGSWFVPVAQFALPAFIAAEIWKASEPRAKPSGAWPFLVWFWWASALLTGLLWIKALSDADAAASVDALVAANRLWMISSALGILSGLLSIQLVVDITRRQERRARMIGRLARLAAPQT